MGRVLVSFLGTGDYKLCQYCFDDRLSSETAYIQTALIETVCHDWDSSDRCVVFATQGAEHKNWSGEKGLQSSIEFRNLPFEVKIVSIPEGKSEADIWDIYSSIFSDLCEEEKVFLDVTHGFRSIPMLALVILNYARVTKGIEIGGIYYGAFEARDTSGLKPQPVPIFNLSGYDHLLRWTFAVDRFVESGDARELSNLADKAMGPLLRATKGKDLDARLVNGVSVALREMADALSTCRATEVTGLAQKLNKRISECKGHSELKPFEPLLDHLKKAFQNLGEDDVLNGLWAATWCSEHNLVQQAYTILDETIITWLVRSVGLDPLARDDRSLITSSLVIFNKNLPEEEWQGEANRRPEKVREAVERYKGIESLIKVIDEVRNMRNDLNHAGCNKYPRSAKSFSEKLPAFLKEANSRIKSSIE